MSTGHAEEIRTGDRFAFGKNWSRFLRELDESRIEQAERSLSGMLQLPSLQGLRFLDVGSGSGLFSLAARRLGAVVHSFDYDPESVACTSELRQRYFADDPSWTIEEGSILDSRFINSLGQWDVVYSWGVLHHTGDLASSLASAAQLVGERGLLFIALYNDQGRSSRMWLRVKKAYNRLPHGLKWLVLWPAAIRLWGPSTVTDLLSGRPFHTWRTYTQSSPRGMSPWRDVVDWVGGLPFEVAAPDQVFRQFSDRGFALRGLRTCAGGHGCNEFVFERQ